MNCGAIANREPHTVNHAIQTVEPRIYWFCGIEICAHPLYGDIGLRVSKSGSCLSTNREQCLKSTGNAIEFFTIGTQVFLMRWIYTYSGNLCREDIAEEKYRQRPGNGGSDRIRAQTIQEKWRSLVLHCLLTEGDASPHKNPERFKASASIDHAIHILCAVKNA